MRGDVRGVVPQRFDQPTITVGDGGNGNAITCSRWDTAGVAELPLSSSVIEALVDQLTEPCRYMRLLPNDVEWAAAVINRDGVPVFLPTSTIRGDHG
jgi:hypothetical protein